MRHAVARPPVVDWVRARLKSKYTIICLHCTNNRCPPRQCTCLTKLVGVWWWPHVTHFCALGPWCQAWGAVRLCSRALERRGFYPRSGWWVQENGKCVQPACSCTWVRHSLQHPSVYIVRMLQVLLHNWLCLMTCKFELHNRFCKDKMVARLQVTIHPYWCYELYK